MWIVSFWHIFHILSYLILFQSLALVPCGGRRKLPRASVVCSYIFSSTGICVGKTLFSYFQFLNVWLYLIQLKNLPRLLIVICLFFGFCVIKFYRSSNFSIPSVSDEG